MATFRWVLSAMPANVIEGGTVVLKTTLFRNSDPLSEENIPANAQINCKYFIADTNAD